LMVIVIWFSGGGPPKGRPRNAKSAISGTDTDAARLEEYKQQIEQEAQRLQLEKAQLARTQGTLAGALAPASPRTAAPQTFLTQAGLPTPLAQGNEDSLQIERRKREYESLFASNIAFTSRKEVPAAKPVAVSPESI